MLGENRHDAGEEKPLSTLIVSHRSSLAHDMGPDHPERPDRVRAIERILENERFQTLLREQAPYGERESILRAHPEAYIGALERAAPAEGLIQLDGDTAMCPGTMEAAMRAVGGACLAVDEVMRKIVANAFVAMRPPGHHA